MPLVIRAGQLIMGAAIAVGGAVTVLTLPRLPCFSPWPVVPGLAAWTVGKYVLCPARWYQVSASGRPLSWHLAVTAESEVLGLVTPGHVGGDLWRVRRLREVGLPGPVAVVDVATDKLVGSLGAALFGVLAAATLPPAAAVPALGSTGAVVLVVLVLRQVRPAWTARCVLPRTRRVVTGVVLSLVDQLTTVTLLIGAVEATGHRLRVGTALGAFGASQLVGFLPGPHGASPRDGVLVAALVTSGLPWSAALGAVCLKATTAFLPALVLGGGCLVLRRLRPRESAAVE